MVSAESRNSCNFTHKTWKSVSPLGALHHCRTSQTASELTVTIKSGRAAADSDCVLARAQNALLSRELRYCHGSSVLISVCVGEEECSYERSWGGLVILLARFDGSAIVLSRLHVGDIYL